MVLYGDPRNQATPHGLFCSLVIAYFAFSKVLAAVNMLLLPHFRNWNAAYSIVVEHENII